MDGSTRGYRCRDCRVSRCHFLLGCSRETTLGTHRESKLQPVAPLFEVVCDLEQDVWG